jgi:signal transduction histidine kinase
MFHSIRWRLIASYVLLTLLTVSLVGILALSLLKRYAEQQEVNYLTANAEALARQAIPLVQPVRREFELFDLAQTASFLGNVRVRILDQRRHVLADSGPHLSSDQFVLIAPLAEQPEVARSVRPVQIVILPKPVEGKLVFPGYPGGVVAAQPAMGQTTVVRRVDGIWGPRLYFEEPTAVQPARPISTTAGVVEFQLSPSPNVSEPSSFRSDRVVTAPVGNKNTPLGYVELSGGPDFGAEALATAQRAFLLAAGGASIVAFLVGLLVSHGLTVPLKNLTTVATQMGGGDLSVRASVQTRDEIGQLAGQFNQMAERLEASFSDLARERDALRRFIADASHELRTPITALRNFNELLRGAAAYDPAAREEFLSESQTQLKRLGWLTDNLLNLSRLEGGLATLDMATHDIGEIISTIHAAFKTLAQEKGLNLSVKYPAAPLSLRCDRARLELVLSNLLVLQPHFNYDEL